jgi:hypothetical protein
VIRKVSWGRDRDHDTLHFTAWIDGTLVEQAFHVLFDTEAQMRAFARDFCAVFGTWDAERIKGRPCYALRCFDQNNEPMEAVESVETGSRISRTTWWRRNVDPATLSPLEQRKREIDRDIRSREHVVERLREERTRLAEGYVAWD